MKGFLKTLFPRLFGDESERIKKQLLTGKLKEVDIEGIKFYVKRLSTQFIFDLQEEQKRATGDNLFSMKEVLYSLVSASICDKNGKQVFPMEDVKGLDIFTLNSLITEAMEFNGLNPDAVDKAKSKLKNMKAQSQS